MLWKNIEQSKKDKSEERCYFIDREVTEKASPRCHLRRDLHKEKKENFREKEEIACAKALWQRRTWSAHAQTRISEGLPLVLKAPLCAFVKVASSSRQISFLSCLSHSSTLIFRESVHILTMCIYRKICEAVGDEVWEVVGGHTLCDLPVNCQDSRFLPWEIWEAFSRFWAEVCDLILL